MSWNLTAVNWNIQTVEDEHVEHLQIHHSSLVTSVWTCAFLLFCSMKFRDVQKEINLWCESGQSEEGVRWSAPQGTHKQKAWVQMSERRWRSGGSKGRVQVFWFKHPKQWRLHKRSEEASASGSTEEEECEECEECDDEKWMFTSAIHIKNQTPLTYFISKDKKLTSASSLVSM